MTKRLVIATAAFRMLAAPAVLAAAPAQAAPHVDMTPPSKVTDSARGQINRVLPNFGLLTH